MEGIATAPLLVSTGCGSDAGADRCAADACISSRLSRRPSWRSGGRGRHGNVVGDGLAVGGGVTADGPF
jgi:hypothetical protein